MNKILKFSFLLITLLSFAGIVFAQSKPPMEYGKTSELKGLTKIFVFTYGDVKSHKRIVEAIKEAKLPDVTFLDSEIGAEIVILFSGEEKRSFSGTLTPDPFSKNYRRTRPVYNGQLAGNGGVFINSADGKLPRRLMIFESTQDQALEKKPAAKFAVEFVKAYKEANNIK